MSHIETIIVLLLLFMAVPDICRKIGRPSVAYAVFVLFGMALGTFIDDRVARTFAAAGEVGFLLLLFEVGLEIELPPVRLLIRAVIWAAGWALIQYPLVMAFAQLAGLGLLESAIAATALTGCSVGMAFPAWKQFKTVNSQEHEFILRIMVSLETMAIILLTTEGAALTAGFTWPLALKLAAVILVVLLVSAFSGPLTRLFQWLLEKTIHWRTHVIILAVLVICAAGERIGLSGAKTAFFLGLFMSRINHDDKPLEDYIAPVSRQFLIPLFFVSMGMQVDWSSAISNVGLLALSAAALVLLFRKFLHYRWFKAGEQKELFLLLGPNLTVAAVGASILLSEGRDGHGVTWLLLTALIMTTASLLALPSRKEHRMIAMEVSTVSPPTSSNPAPQVSTGPESAQPDDK